jgi:hypothetical protein
MTLRSVNCLLSKSVAAVRNLLTEHQMQHRSL